MMCGKNSEVEALLNQNQWHKERIRLRSLIVECGLEENVKWGKLCYTFEENIVVIIYGLKSYCALGFFKGSLLSDDEGVLIQPGKHSQAMRQLRFTDVQEINESESTITAFIEKAIQVEKEGLEVEFVEKDNLTYPDELQNALDDDSEFSEAFGDLTPGRQRGYVLHFSDPKQAKTRQSRIEKCRSKILDGKGLNER